MRVILQMMVFSLFSTQLLSYAGIEGAWKLKGYRCASGVPFGNIDVMPEQYNVFFGENHFSKELIDSKGCVSKYLPYRYKIVENEITPDLGGEYQRNTGTVLYMCPPDNLPLKGYVGISDIAFEYSEPVLTFRINIPYVCSPTGDALIDFVRK